MTVKNNRAPLIYFVKRCTSLQSHWWIQIRVTVRNHLIQVRIGNILWRVTLKFDGWPWKTIGHLSYTTSNFVHHYIMICDWSYRSETVNLSLDLCDLDLRPLALTFGMDITFISGNYLWEFHDDTMTGTLSKRVDRGKDRRTDRRADRQTDWTNHRAPFSHLKTTTRLVTMTRKFDHTMSISCFPVILEYNLRFLY